MSVTRDSPRERRQGSDISVRACTSSRICVKNKLINTREQHVLMSPLHLCNLNDLSREQSVSRAWCFLFRIRPSEKTEYDVASVPTENEKESEREREHARSIVGGQHRPRYKRKSALNHVSDSRDTLQVILTNTKHQFHTLTT